MHNGCDDFVCSVMDTAESLWFGLVEFESCGCTTHSNSQLFTTFFFFISMMGIDTWYENRYIFKTYQSQGKHPFQKSFEYGFDRNVTAKNKNFVIDHCRKPPKSYHSNVKSTVRVITPNIWECLWQFHFRQKSTFKLVWFE